LTEIATSDAIPKPTDGFFTSISSHGDSADSAIIWAVAWTSPEAPIAGIPQRTTPNAPNPPPGTPAKPKKIRYVRLLAFAASPTNGKLQQFLSIPVGSWTFGGDSFGCCHANIVPTVANGYVYVASENQMAIMGVPPPTIRAAFLYQLPRSATGEVPVAQIFVRSQAPERGARAWGRVVREKDDFLKIRLRDGRLLAVNAELAIKNELARLPKLGQSVSVHGVFNPKSQVLRAAQINDVPQAQARWGRDRLH
jgi:hypothetical protein